MSVLLGGETSWINLWANEETFGGSGGVVPLGIPNELSLVCLGVERNNSLAFLEFCDGLCETKANAADTTSLYRGASLLPVPPEAGLCAFENELTGPGDGVRLISSRRERSVLVGRFLLGDGFRELESLLGSLWR